MDSHELIAQAQALIRAESDVLAALADQLDESFVQAVHLVSQCTGHILVTGAGTSGAMAHRMAHLLATCGIHAFYMTPGDALHGEAAITGPNDVLIALSKAGKSAEINQFASIAKQRGSKVITLTAKPDSELAKLSDVVAVIKTDDAAEGEGILPFGNTLAHGAFGDALVLLARRLHGFDLSQMTQTHPSGGVADLIRDTKPPRRQERSSSNMSTLTNESSAQTKQNSRRWRVLIGSRSFGQAFPEHLHELENLGCEVVLNPVGRALREDELLEAIKGIDAIITGTDELTARVIRSADRLKTIVKHGVGLETIDLQAARERGIVVSATPGAIHDSVADLTMALLLALARKIVPSHLATQQGSWKATFGMELRDKTMGLVGLGRIGKAVAVRAKAFGMRIVASDPYPDQAFAAVNAVSFLPLAELLMVSDVVSLHAAAEQVGGTLIGPNELKLMKPTAFLINTARGQLVDEDALAAAIREGRLGGAGIDAFVNEPPSGSPLLTLDNVVLTPHLGGRTLDGQRRMGEIAIQNCVRALRGEAPLFTA